MPSAARPRRSGKPKVASPSPPNVVPMRVKRASFSLIGSSWPWQSAQPTGAKLKPTAMIWPTYGWLICASPSRRRSVANRSPSRRSRRRPPPSRKSQPREAEQHQRPGRRLGGRRRAFGRNVEDELVAHGQSNAVHIHGYRVRRKSESAGKSRSKIGGTRGVHRDLRDVGRPGEGENIAAELARRASRKGTKRAGEIVEDRNLGVADRDGRPAQKVCEVIDRNDRQRGIGWAAKPVIVENGAVDDCAFCRRGRGRRIRDAQIRGCLDGCAHQPGLRRRSQRAKCREDRERQDFRPHDTFPLEPGRRPSWRPRKLQRTIVSSAETTRRTQIRELSDQRR